VTEPATRTPAPAAAAPTEPDVGSHLGKYLLLKELGRGGMGRVFEAQDPDIDRRVAVKVLPRNADADRKLREARAAGRLNHPNTVAIHDAGVSDGRPFLVMELLEGGSAAELAKAGPMPWWQATRIVADACRGLAAAHAVGLIHRDIKPGNILCAGDGSAKLGDFGLARSTDSTSSEFDRTGGTPQYMSPEQCRAESLDSRSDIYSLGATYFTLLTGRLPYAEADNHHAGMFAHCVQPPPDPRDFVPEVPSACAALVRRAMAKIRADRPADAGEMLAELESLLSPEIPILAKPTRRNSAFSVAPAEATSASKRKGPSPAAVAIAALVVAALLTVSGIWLMRDRSPVATKVPPPETPAVVAPAPTPPPAPIDPPVPSEPPPPDSLLHEAAIRCVAVATDGSIAAGSIDGSVTLWEPQGSRIRTVLRGHSAQVNAVAFSGDSLTLATVGLDNKVLLWNARTGDRVGSRAGHAKWALGAAIHPRDGRLATAGDDSEVRLWSADGSSVRPLRGHKHWVETVSFSHDGALLATASLDRTARVWNLADGGDPIELKGHDSFVLSAAFSPDARWVATGSDDRTVCVWDARTGVRRMRLTGFAGEVRALAWSPDGKWIAVGDYRTLGQGRFRGTVTLFNADDGTRRATAEGHPSQVAGLAFSADGSRLASCAGRDAIVLLWRTADLLRADAPR